jgi:hypothetical protein
MDLIEHIKQGDRINDLESALKNTYTLIPATGEITEELQEQINYLEMSINNRISTYSNLLDVIQMKYNAIKKEKDRLDGERRLLEKQEELLKEMLMTETNGISTDNYTIFYKDYVSIKVDDEIDLESLKQTYPNLVRTKYELKKKEANDYFKNTDMLPNHITREINHTIQIRRK